MKRKATGGFTLIELMIVITILVALMALAAITYTGVQKSQKQVACEKHQKDIVMALIGYRQAHGKFPEENGKLLITWLYMIGDLTDPKTLQCPGEGAENDKPVTLDQLTVVRGDKTIEQLEGELEKNWDDRQISYWGANGDKARSTLQDEKFVLERLLSPTDQDKQDLLDAKKSWDESTIPLIGDDNDDPRNHEGVIIVGYVDGRVRVHETEWDESRLPFAALSGK